MTMSDAEKIIGLIPKPIEPVREPDEDTNLPDQKHNWIKDEDDPDRIDVWQVDTEYHNGPRCADCEFDFCHHCDRKGYEDKSCLRTQAENRNMSREFRYLEAMKFYAIENLYYNKMVNHIRNLYDSAQ